MNILPITVKGIKYPSLKAASAALGIPYQTMISRRLNGVTLDAPPRNTKCVIIGGVKYASRMAACRELGICKTVVIRAAKRMNLTWEQAAERAVEMKADKEVTLFGRRWPSMRQAWMQHHAPGVSMQMVYDRIIDGWDPETAILHPPLSGRIGTVVTIHGVKYPSVTRALAAYGLLHEQLRHAALVAKGISHDDALKEIIQTARPVEQCKR